MSKLVKNMEIQALRKDFEGLRDMLIVEVNGVDSLANSGLRTNLRKKKISLKLVKNSFAKKIFSENGISFPNQSIW
ncbi:MAG: 50S ribosomal protein L10, partial [Gemmataceae bacterium]